MYTRKGRSFSDDKVMKHDIFLDTYYGRGSINNHTVTLNYDKNAPFQLMVCIVVLQSVFIIQKPYRTTGHFHHILYN